MSKKGPKSEMPSAQRAPAKMAVAPDADTIVDPPQVRVAKGKGSAPKSRSSMPPPSKKRVSKPPVASSPPPAVVSRSSAPSRPASLPPAKPTHVAPLDPTPLAPGVAPKADSVRAAAPRPDSVKVTAAAPSPELDDHAEHFFKAGEAAEREASEQARAQSMRPSGVTTGEHEPADPRLLQLASPAARARRAKFEKWVKAAVGVSAVLCLAALVRVAVARVSHDADPAHAVTEVSHGTPPATAAVPVTAAAAPAAVAAAPAAAPAAPAETTAPAAVTAPAAAAAAATGAAPVTAPAEATPAAAAAPADSAQAVVATSDKTAPEEKKDARVSLERGKVKDAIAAGERSVALDPTDGEAWLILGAAYQEAGKGADARRCFNACLKQGKKGPLNECRAMLQ